MSKVLHTHVAVEIDRGPDEVWPVVSDYASDTQWRKGITEMTPRPAGSARGGHSGPRGPRAGGQGVHHRHRGHRNRPGDGLPLRR